VERYASYRYDEDVRERAASLGPLVTDSLSQELAIVSGGAAARQRMMDERAIAVATVEAVQTQALRSDAVELLVIVRQDIDRSGEREQRRPTYQLALVPSPKGWAVASVST